jgi:hypothetical protein
MPARILHGGREGAADRIEDEEDEQKPDRDDDCRDRRVPREEAHTPEGAREADRERGERDCRADAERRTVDAGNEALPECPCE